MAKKKILVVSGDPKLIDLLGAKLSADGYQVMMSGEEREPEIKTIVDKENPDLLVVDIMMPRMEGIKISIGLRQSHDVPVLMLTTHNAEKNKVKGLDPRAKSGLTDSIDTDELTDWIKEIFARNNGSKYK